MNNIGYGCKCIQKSMHTPITVVLSESKSLRHDSYLKFFIKIYHITVTLEIYEIQVQQFEGGHLERVIKFLKKIQSVINGENVMSGFPKFFITRSFLLGYNLLIFEYFTRGFTKTNDKGVVGHLKGHSTLPHKIPK